MENFKYLHELYEKPIDRAFNPAVNASDFKEATVRTEIDEYVFTDEIINNLFSVLQAVRDRAKSHNGIWINGYFGSGKSHFLKYLDYCLHPKYNKRALARLAEAVKAHDPLLNPSSKCNVTIADMNDLSSWLRTAKVETILFNIGSVANSNTNEQHVFTEVFWNELNRHRGYNTFNLPLAQYFEKVLDQKGKFDEFKQRLSDNGFNWETDGANLATTELDLVLDLGREIVPTLSTDVIRKHIANNDITLSVEAFMKELKEYIDKTPDNFRLIFFADEISQFIDSRAGLLLQLQQIVSDLQEACGGKVWIACTAQQDLSEIVGDCHINQADENYGKILGRFEVKVSLKGTNSEYITQKRILEKKGSAAIELSSLYDTIKNNITAQLNLPTGYNAYRSREEFAAYYPFVPYQFSLMMNIFDAFVEQNFVDREVKGNERSIIKITHSVAIDTKDQEVGDVISFDQFYNAMFRGSLTAKGQKAIATANQVIESYHDRDLGERVVNILFMICNMKEQERRVFPATADHITSLLMRDMDVNRQKLKSDVQSVLDYLCQNNILRRDTLADGSTEFYTFFTEEERRVANAIANQPVDNDFLSGVLIDLFKELLNPNNRENYHTTKLSVGGTLNDKTFLYGLNANIIVDFVLESDRDADRYAFQNQTNRLAFYMADAYKADQNLQNRLFWICRVKKYLSSPDGQNSSEARRQALDKFRAMMREEYKNYIEPEFKKLFNNATVISSQQTLAIASSTRNQERYKEAMRRHLDNIYHYASLADGNGIPTKEPELRAKIARPIQAGEYKDIPLTAPETEIENFLKRSGLEKNLKDIVAKFSDIPYGWSQEATIFFVNELVRRNMREFTYNNAENPDRTLVANNIVREMSKFMVRPTKEISADLINEFLEAWRDIFNDANVPNSNNLVEIHAFARDMLNRYINTNQDIFAQIAQYPIAKRLLPSIELSKKWQTIRDDEQFFKCVIADRAEGKRTMDDAKQIRDFADRFLTGYKSLIEFVNNNRDNWDSLPDTCRADVEKMKGIITDEWPIDNMPSYGKMQRALNVALDNLRNELRSEIKAKLEEQDAKLRKFAEENEVEYTGDVKRAIDRATISSAISTLRYNSIDNSWRNTEVEKINKAIEMKNQKPKPGGGPAAPKPPTPKKIMKVKLSTSTLQNIKSEEDIDNYLAGLRKQLINKLGDADEIQVL